MLAMVAWPAARPRIKYGACPLLMVSLSNQLSGQILPELGNLVSLKILDLADALHSASQQGRQRQSFSPVGRYLPQCSLLMALTSPSKPFHPEALPPDNLSLRQDDCKVIQTHKPSVLSLSNQQDEQKPMGGVTLQSVLAWGTLRWYWRCRSRHS